MSELLRASPQPSSAWQPFIGGFSEKAIPVAGDSLEDEKKQGRIKPSRRRECVGQPSQSPFLSRVSKGPDARRFCLVGVDELTDARAHDDGHVRSDVRDLAVLAYENINLGVYPVFVLTKKS